MTNIVTTRPSDAWLKYTITIYSNDNKNFHVGPK